MKIKPSIRDPVMALQVIIALSVYYNKQGFYFSGIDAVIKQKKREFVIKWQGRKKVAELARITSLAERSIYEIYEELQRNKQRDLFCKTEERPPT
jgi:Mor family transcriptional regulator